MDYSHDYLGHNRGAVIAFVVLVIIIVLVAWWAWSRNDDDKKSHSGSDSRSRSRSDCSDSKYSETYGSYDDESSDSDCPKRKH